jgi:hypothetical protein
MISFKNVLLLIIFQKSEKNGLIFTYGVTNAGKTYTIMGDTSN